MEILFTVNLADISIFGTESPDFDCSPSVTFPIPSIKHRDYQNQKCIVQT